MSELTERLRSEWRQSELDDWWLREAAVRIDELEALKVEGLVVLDEWEQVWKRCPQRPEHLGLKKASIVAARIDELEAALRVAEVGEKFGKVATSERNLAWHRLDKANTRIAELKEALREIDILDSHSGFCGDIARRALGRQR